MDKKIISKNSVIETFSKKPISNYFINGDLDYVPKFTKLTGVSFNGRQKVIEKLDNTSLIKLKRDYENEIDRYAIAVYHNNDSIGWVPRDIAKNLAPQIDNGINWQVKISQVTGKDKGNLGVNIELISKDLENLG